MLTIPAAYDSNHVLPPALEMRRAQHCLAAAYAELVLVLSAPLCAASHLLNSWSNSTLDRYSVVWSHGLIRLAINSHIKLRRLLCLPKIWLLVLVVAHSISFS